MMPEEAGVPKSYDELVSSFQVLHMVAEAMTQIMSGSDAALVTPTLSRIQQKFASCEQILDNLPGGSMTHNEQIQEIQRLRDNLKRKRQLLERYGKHDVIARALSKRTTAGGITNASKPKIKSKPTRPSSIATSMTPATITATTTTSSSTVNNKNMSMQQQPTQPQPSQVESQVQLQQTDNDNVMEDDFGEITEVTESLPKDDELLGLEI